MRPGLATTAPEKQLSHLSTRRSPLGSHRRASPPFLILEVWGGALGFTFLSGSLTMLDWNPFSENLCSRTLLLQGGSARSGGSPGGWSETRGPGPPLQAESPAPEKCCQDYLPGRWLSPSLGSGGQGWGKATSREREAEGPAGSVCGPHSPGVAAVGPLPWRGCKCPHSCLC